MIASLEGNRVLRRVGLSTEGNELAAGSDQKGDSNNGADHGNEDCHHPVGHRPDQSGLHVSHLSTEFGHSLFEVSFGSYLVDRVPRDSAHESFRALWSDDIAETIVEVDPGCFGDGHDATMPEPSARINRSRQVCETSRRFLNFALT